MGAISPKLNYLIIPLWSLPLMKKVHLTIAINRIKAEDLDPRCRAQVRKGLSLVKPEWIYESIKRKRKLPLLKSYVADQTLKLIYRLLVKASETAQVSSQFERTLEQLDASIERYPSDRLDPDEEDEEYEDEPIELEPEIKDEDPSAGVGEPRSDAPKTDRQRGMEAEWGLYRSPQLSQNVDDEDEDETDDERRRDTFKSTEEDYMVCPSPC